MFQSILGHTPVWVWMLLGGLIALGLRQTRPRSLSATRVRWLPALVAALSLYAATNGLHRPGIALVAWLGGFALALALCASGEPAGATYDEVTRRYAVPGSWVPLAVILTIFVTRYVAIVAVAVRPGLAGVAVFVAAVAVIGGICSGVFCGRAASLLRIARPAAPVQSRVVAA